MKVLIPLVDGFEEIEAITIIDVLRRAKIDVTVVGLITTVVEGSHNIKVIIDKRFSEINPEQFDALVLPGGSPGYINLANSNTILNLVKDFNQKKKIIGAICGAPIVLAKAGILEDKIATCYPGLENKIPRPREGSVIVDKNIITSKGPGTAMSFALKLVEILAGKKEMMRLREELVFSE
ncbi:MAG: DJ-1/PfpI family protein [Candidatus Aenigmatarchaeota archaeon]